VVLLVFWHTCIPGLGCTTVTSPDGAGLAAAQILGLSDHLVWSSLRAKQLNTWVGLKEADMKARKANVTMATANGHLQNGH